MSNALYHGNNPDVLRFSVVSGSVDSIYPDPPFNLNAGYDLLCRFGAGARAKAQIEAFGDAWHSRSLFVGIAA